MSLEVGPLSYLFAALTFSLLAVLVLAAHRGQDLTRQIAFATVASALWAAAVSVQMGMGAIPPDLVILLELLRTAAWSWFLLKVIELRVAEVSPGATIRRWKYGYLAIVGVQAMIALIGPRLAPDSLLQASFKEAYFIVLVVLALSGLMLLEHAYRNASATSRWSIKFMCLGLGAIYTFDFFMYAQAILFKQLDPQLWSARGLINGLAVPLLAVSIARNPNWRLGIQVSRHVVFQSITLMGAGLYMLAMAFAGYLIQYIGGNWSAVIQVTFLVASGLLLAVLLFSGRIRANLRVWLSKHFFSYKYDYRDEWSSFTRTLAENPDNVPDAVVQGLASLVQSESGTLWLKTGSSFELVANWQMRPPVLSSRRSLEQLAEFCTASQWVVDLDEYRDSPDLYAQLDLDDDLSAISKAWLVVPLFFEGNLQGLVILSKSGLVDSINWEDRDLLKVAGQQAASHLAQYLANQALVQARQFEAFNRLSAYVVHDLKNILAQQSLIVSNAEKHKHKPEFVDDVIRTVGNSVDRMSRLMEQMRSGIRASQTRSLSLEAILNDVIGRAASRSPVPVYQGGASDLLVEADEELLTTVFAHIVQNAQEATPASGWVRLEAAVDDNMAVISIEDSGEGMDSEFIAQRLFKPFDSTKGLTGMGVGAFESREYIRSLGGDISVKSDPGLGSLFRIVIPCTHTDQEHAE